MAQELLIIFWQREQKSLIQNMFSNAKICSNTVQVVTTIRKDGCCDYLNGRSCYYFTFEAKSISKTWPTFYPSSLITHAFPCRYFFQRLVFFLVGWAPFGRALRIELQLATQQKFSRAPGAE